MDHKSDTKKAVTLTFTTAQLSVLNTALMELPYRVAAPLIQHINAQIQAQFDAAAYARDTPSGYAPPKE
jgi:hypothetical protein